MINENINVSIVGVGYIGTVISCALASEKVTINGIDLDQGNIDLLNQGQTLIHEPGIDKEIDDIVKKGYFSCSSDFSSMSESSVIIVTVGTPLSDTLDANLSQVERVAEEIGKHVSKNTLICLKSTVIPGTTEKFSEIVSKISGLQIVKTYILHFLLKNC